MPGAHTRIARPPRRQRGRRLSRASRSPLPPDPDVDKLTDFNDLHKAEGLDVVREQLREEIERVELARQVRKMVDEAVRDTKRTRR
jgi:hypothetical protein